MNDSNYKTHPFRLVLIVFLSLGFTRHDIKNRAKTKELVILRWVAIHYLIQNDCFFGSNQDELIGQVFGRDRCTVRNAIKRIKDRIESDKEFKRIVHDIGINLQLGKVRPVLMPVLEFHKKDEVKERYRKIYEANKIKAYEKSEKDLREERDRQKFEATRSKRFNEIRPILIEQVHQLKQLEINNIKSDLSGKFIF
jgi:hypothetical protein